MKSPQPFEIRSLRDHVGDTIGAAASRVHVTIRAWSYWESGDRVMPAACWELYLVKTGQLAVHPDD